MLSLRPSSTSLSVKSQFGGTPSAPMRNSRASARRVYAFLRGPHHRPARNRMEQEGHDRSQKDESTRKKSVTFREATEASDNDDCPLIQVPQLGRNVSYETEETEDCPTTMASTTQPTASGEHDASQDNALLPLVELEQALSPPPESVSLLMSGSVCSELSEDEPNQDDAQHQQEQQQRERKREPSSLGLGGEDSNPEGGNNYDESTASANFRLHPSTQFVPPEYVYLTPDACWPLEL